MSVNLESLTHAELQALISNAQSKIGEAKAQEINAVRAKIQDTLNKAKLTLEEVFPTRGKGKAAGKVVAPKFRNPADASQTWSGRGKRPTWFKQALAQGQTEASLLIGASVAAPKVAKSAPKKQAKAAVKKPVVAKAAKKAASKKVAKK